MLNRSTSSTVAHGRVPGGAGCCPPAGCRRPGAGGPGAWSCLRGRSPSGPMEGRRFAQRLRRFSALVSPRLGSDPLSGHCYVFLNATRVRGPPRPRGAGAGSGAERGDAGPKSPRFSTTSSSRRNSAVSSPRSICSTQRQQPPSTPAPSPRPRTPEGLRDGFAVEIREGFGSASTPRTYNGTTTISIPYAHVKREARPPGSGGV